LGIFSDRGEYAHATPLLCSKMAEQAAALVWTVRLQALAAHLEVNAQYQELPVQSRIAQIDQNLTQLVASHVSLRQLLAQGAFLWI